MHNISCFYSVQTIMCIFQVWEENTKELAVFISLIKTNLILSSTSEKNISHENYSTFHLALLVTILLLCACCGKQYKDVGSYNWL